MWIPTAVTGSAPLRSAPCLRVRIKAFLQDRTVPVDDGNINIETLLP